MIDLIYTFGSMSTKQTLSDEDGVRIINAIRSFLLRGLPNGTSLTDQEVFDMYVIGRTVMLKQLVQNEEGEAAARAAKAAIPPISTTEEAKP